MHSVKQIYPCLNLYVQWNLRIKDSQGTVKNCPEYQGGFISQVHFRLLSRPKD